MERHFTYGYLQRGMLFLPFVPRSFYLGRHKRGKSRVNKKRVAMRFPKKMGSPIEDKNSFVVVKHAQNKHAHWFYQLGTMAKLTRDIRDKKRTTLITVSMRKQVSLFVYFDLR